MSVSVHNPTGDQPAREDPNPLATGAGYAAFSVVSLATSLGGAQAVSQLLAGLPAYFPTPVIIAQHLHTSTHNYLADHLRRHTRLLVKPALDGDRLRAGTVYAVPGGCTVTVQPGDRLALTSGMPIGLGRPSANLLFQSTAAVYGPRALAVVLTGGNTDGAQGVRAIKKAGGRVLAQTPSTCRAPNMPNAAIATGCVDFVLPLDGLARALVSLVMMPGVSSYLAVPTPAWALF